MIVGTEQVAMVSEVDILIAEHLNYILVHQNL